MWRLARRKPVHHFSREDTVYVVMYESHHPFRMRYTPYSMTGPYLAIKPDLQDLRKFQGDILSSELPIIRVEPFFHQCLNSTSVHLCFPHFLAWSFLNASPDKHSEQKSLLQWLFPGSLTQDRKTIAKFQGTGDDALNLVTGIWVGRGEDKFWKYSRGRVNKTWHLTV